MMMVVMTVDVSGMLGLLLQLHLLLLQLLHLLRGTGMAYRGRGRVVCPVMLREVFHPYYPGRRNGSSSSNYTRRDLQ